MILIDRFWIIKIIQDPLPYFIQGAINSFRAISSIWDTRFHRSTLNLEPFSRCGTADLSPHFFGQAQFNHQLTDIFPAQFSPSSASIIILANLEYQGCELSEHRVHKSPVVHNHSSIPNIWLRDYF